MNRSDHWFTVRKIGGKWYNLNSSQERPELVSEFYLAAFLSQLRADSYTVFIARGGNIPAQGNPDLDGLDERWYRESDLSGNPSAASLAHATNKFVPFRGTTGRRLDDKGSANLSVPSFDVNDEDSMITAAIQASLLETSSVAVKTTAPGDDLRAMR